MVNGFNVSWSVCLLFFSPTAAVTLLSSQTPNISHAKPAAAPSNSNKLIGAAHCELAARLCSMLKRMPGHMCARAICGIFFTPTALCRRIVRRGWADYVRYITIHAVARCRCLCPCDHVFGGWMTCARAHMNSNAVSR